MYTNKLKKFGSILSVAAALALLPSASRAADLFANNITVTNNAYVGGKIGVGTTSPSVDIDVVGSYIRLHNTSSYSTIENRADPATSALKLFGGGDSYTYSVVWFFDTSNNGWEQAFNDENNGDKTMSIKYHDSGYGFASIYSLTLVPPTGSDSGDALMGVNLNTPTEALEVGGNIKADGIFIGDGSGIYVPEQGDLSMGSFTAD